MLRWVLYLIYAIKNRHILEEAVGQMEDQSHCHDTLLTKFIDLKDELGSYISTNTQLELDLSDMEKKLARCHSINNNLIKNRDKYKRRVVELGGPVND